MSFVAEPRLGRPGRATPHAAFRVIRPFAQEGTASHAPTAAGRDGPVDRVVVTWVTIDLVLMMLLQKFALPLPGDAQVSMLLITHYGVLGVLMLARRATVDPTRLALYVVFAGLSLVSQLAGDRAFAPTSLLLAVAIYGALVIVMPIGTATYRRILANFQLVGVAVCLLVFLDHAIQLAGRDMPNIEAIQPAAMIYREYVYIQPLYWGSPYSKPNAIFLLEASVTSQFIAMALVLELALFQRLRLILLFGCALVATFAGTGLLLVLLALPMLLNRVRPALIAAGLLALPVVLGLAAATGWFDVVAKRFDEHEKQGSSSNARFVAPLETVVSVLQGEPAMVLFGMGAGNIERRPGVVWAPFSKVVVEYGVLVFAAWLVFFSHAVLSAGAPLVAAWIALIQYHFLNGSFLVPLDVYLCVILAAGYRLIEPAATIPLAKPGRRPFN